MNELHKNDDINVEIDGYTAIKPVSWLKNVPTYKAGKPPKPGGLALSANESSTFSPLITKALSNVESWNRYPSPLADSLREELAHFHGVSPDQILVSNGSDELVQLLMLAYVGHGGEVVAADPPYAMSRINAFLIDANFHGVPLINYAHDLKSMATNKADLAYVVNPHNPTGTYLKYELLKEFLHTSVAKINVIDEAYIDFVQGINKNDSINFIKNKKTVILRTFSKAYGLAGFRVGYLIADKEIVANLRKVRAPFSVTSPAQIAALAALKDQEFLHKNVTQTIAAREELSSFLIRKGFKVPPSQSNFILLTGVQEAEIIEELSQKNISVRAGSSLGIPGSVRITVPTLEQLPMLLKALELIL